MTIWGPEAQTWAPSAASRNPANRFSASSVRGKAWLVLVPLGKIGPTDRATVNSAELEWNFSPQYTTITQRRCAVLTLVRHGASDKRDGNRRRPYGFEKNQFKHTYKRKYLHEHYLNFQR